MAVITIRLTTRFVCWTCDCGTTFRYPDGQFPSRAVNEHWDYEGCPSEIKRMAGAGRYDYGLRYVIEPPQPPKQSYGKHPTKRGFKWR